MITENPKLCCKYCGELNYAEDLWDGFCPTCVAESI